MSCDEPIKKCGEAIASRILYCSQNVPGKKGSVSDRKCKGESAGTQNRVDCIRIALPEPVLTGHQVRNGVLFHTAADFVSADGISGKIIPAGELQTAGDNGDYKRRIFAAYGIIGGLGYAVQIGGTVHTAFHPALSLFPHMCAVIVQAEVNRTAN